MDNLDCIQTVKDITNKQKPNKETNKNQTKQQTSQANTGKNDVFSMIAKTQHLEAGAWAWLQLKATTGSVVRQRLASTVLRRSLNRAKEARLTNGCTEQKSSCHEDGRRLVGPRGAESSKVPALQSWRRATDCKGPTELPHAIQQE